MVSTLKTLGLALGALLVMAAAFASTASAQQGVLTSEGPVTLTGTETGESQNRMTFFGAFLECPGSTYTVHKYDVTPHEPLPSSATEATLTPHYKETKLKEEKSVPNCVGVFGWSGTIHMNGCDYVVALDQATGEGLTYGITFGIVCPEGKEIEVTLWTSESDHTSKPNSPFCKLDIPPQTGLTGAHATVTKDGHIDIVGIVEGIKAKKTHQDEHAGTLCNNAETTTGKLDLDITLSGHDAEGEPTEISISDS